MNFKVVYECAEFLGKKDDLSRIAKIENLISEGKYFLTFWGHFSAGKSRLINTIIGKDILPYNNTETTSVLTYIQSGNEDCCNIIFDDGTIKQIELESVKSIFQNSERIDDDIDINKIDHLEIFLCNSNLHKGLILVDTPGVNTVIQKHQVLAAVAMEMAGKIFYVLGNSISNVDKEFIKKIHDIGIETIFIRTKCDLINPIEEDPEKTLLAEKTYLENYLGHDIEFFNVSSERDSIYFKNIDLINNRIGEIIENLSMEMEEAAKNKLSIMLDDYKKEIIAEREHISEILKGEEDKIHEKIFKCEKDLEYLNTVADSSEESIKNKIKNIKKSSQVEIDNLIDMKEREFSISFENIRNSYNIENEAKILYKEKIDGAILNVKQILDVNLTDIITSEQKESIKHISSTDIEMSVPEYREVSIENSNSIKMYKEMLVELKNEIEFVASEQAKNNSWLENFKEFDETEYENAISKIDDTLNNLPSGSITNIVPNDEIQPSQIFKGIGQAADLALLLLPGEAIVAGVKYVADATKLAQIMHKTGKLGKAIGSAAKYAKGIDKVRDIVYATNTVLKTRRYSTKAEKLKAAELIDKSADFARDRFEEYKENRNSGNVLDMLSVAYWTEKFGKQFDAPPKIEVDVEAENERNRIRQDLYEQKNKILNDKIKKKKELQLVKNREDELKFQKKEKQAMIISVESELKAQETKILEAAKKIAFDDFKRKFVSCFSECVERMKDKFLREYFLIAEPNISFYIAKKNNDIINKIKEKKLDLQNLLDMKNSDNKELSERRDFCNYLLSNMDIVK